MVSESWHYISALAGGGSKCFGSRKEELGDPEKIFLR